MRTFRYQVFDESILMAHGTVLWCTCPLVWVVEVPVFVSHCYPLLNGNFHIIAFTGKCSISYYFRGKRVLLTHCRRNGLPTPTHKHTRYILEDSNFDFRYVRLCDLNIYEMLRFRYSLRKVVELFVNSVLWRLIWVCTVCQLPFKGPQTTTGKQEFCKF